MLAQILGSRATNRNKMRGKPVSLDQKYSSRFNLEDIAHCRNTKRILVLCFFVQRRVSVLQDSTSTTLVAR